MPKLPTLSIKLRPTTPEEFARPLGNAVDLELRSRRADSQVLAATTKLRARMRCSVFDLRSIYTAASARPRTSREISRAIAFVTSERRPVASAGGSSTWLELKFDALMQPREHWPQ